MRAFTDNELEIIGEVITNKIHYSDGGATKSFYLDSLKKRRDYLFPVVTELAKKKIRLKDICPDLSDEYNIIIKLIEYAETL